MSLATLAELKERLDISVSTRDTELQSYLDRATGRIEEIVGRRLAEQADVNEYLDGDGTPFLNLRLGPIDSVTSVSSVTYDSAGNESLTALTANVDYFVRGLRADDWLLPSFIEVVGAPTLSGRRNYKVVYTAGWSVATVPKSLALACLHAAIWEENKRKNTATRDRQVDVVHHIFRTEAALLTELQHMLRPFIPRMFV